MTTVRQARGKQNEVAAWMVRRRVLISNCLATVAIITMVTGWSVSSYEALGAGLLIFLLALFFGA